MTTEGKPADEVTLDSEDGHRIAVLGWHPADGRCIGTVQILHGMAEHAGRYERFAEFMTAQGFAIFAHNHRGHGSQPDSGQPGHFADHDGWQKVIDDAGLVHEHVTRRYPDAPRLLFGHSMGSYVAQAYLMQKARSIDALVLSGSTSAPRLQLYFGRFAARIEMWLRGRRHASDALNAQAFGAFNKRFEPARTDFDWLSRDPVEVDRYVGDPACGFVPTATLWHDLLGGLLQISKASSMRSVPAELPILITGGSDDPVGGLRGMQRLHVAYSKTAHTQLTLKIYNGGRHEMLNETNRDEFMRDVADWTRAALTGK